MRAPLVMGGNKITGVSPGTAPTDVATVSQIGESVGVPIGAVIDYFGNTPPDGYLFCAGQAVSRSTYSALFAVLGTAAGPGDGSTTFNLPDYRGRVGAGRDNMNGASAGRLNSLPSTALGAGGGSQSHTLTQSEMPVHTHAVTDPGHTHSSETAGAIVGVANGLDNSAAGTSPASETGEATTGISLGNTGNGQAHNNVQPTVICNKIIRAL